MAVCVHLNSQLLTLNMEFIVYQTNSIKLSVEGFLFFSCRRITGRSGRCRDITSVAEGDVKGSRKTIASSFPQEQLGWG